MPITTDSLLIPFILNGPNRYIATEKKYTASVNTPTIKAFGPSGSLKKMNSILEQIIAVTANIINETFFDLKYRPAALSMSIR